MREGKWVGLKEPGLGAVEVREVGGIDSWGSMEGSVNSNFLFLLHVLCISCT